MSIAIYIFISFVYFLICLFILWKKLKDDYIASQIFGAGFLIYFCLITTFAVIRFLKIQNGEWFIPALPMAVLYWYSSRRKMRINELINALAPSLIIGNTYFYFINLMRGKVWMGLVGIILSLMLLPVYTYLEKNFKKLHWYKSGKVGFSGLFVLSIFFVINGIVAFVSPDMVFFTGKINAIISLSLGMISLAGLYLLSNKVS